MLKLAAAIILATSVGNVPVVNSNPDASPPGPPYVAMPGPPADATIQHGVFDPRGTPGLPISVRIVNFPPTPPPSNAASDALVRQLQAAQDGTRTLVGAAVVFLGLQTLIFLVGLYFIIRMANDRKRSQPSP
jgi:hypothetical protein